MTELEKIEYAKSFVDKLANGINPLDDSPIPTNDIANNVRLSRCFFYVSEILRQVLENGGINPIKVAKQRKNEFALPKDAFDKIRISETPVSASEMSNYLNELIDVETTKKLSAASINNWLITLGMLEVVKVAGGYNRKRPTELGKEIGIFTEERTGQNGAYMVVLFSPQAQQFVYDNIAAIIGLRHEKTNAHCEFQGQSWTKNHDECLIDLFKKNTPVSEIAGTLKRSEGGVRARLKRLGLIENRSDAK